MKRYFILTIISSIVFLSGCQQRMFGVDETTWSSLSEHEREKVIEGYNKRREIELINSLKTKEKELENERHRQEVEAQTAPFYAAAEAISSICGKESKQKTTSFHRIQAITPKGITHLLTIRDTEFEIDPFSTMSDAWFKGQKVQILSNKDKLYYSVKIKNLENGETVSARKV